MAREDRKVEFRQATQVDGDKMIGWLRLPSRWLQKMRVHPQKPDVALFFDGEKITIEQPKIVGIRRSPLAGRARLHRFALVWLVLIESHNANPEVERFFGGNTFGDECLALGFDMDCGQPLEKAVPGVSDPFKSQVFASHVAKLDIQTLGNAIFSRWRWWTHWDECTLDEDGWTWFVLALKRLAKLTEEDKV